MLLRVLLSLFACASLQVPPPPERGRDPWVFRCVLDQHPRMVVIALSKELWCAYDAQHCSFYAAWKGRAKLQGAVYDTVHGPQPVIEGTRYTSGFDEHAWEIYVGETLVAADVRWGGYWMHDGRCTLLYEVTLPDGRHFQVRETPEFVRPEQLFPEEQMQDFVLTRGDTGLWRSFQFVDPPKDVKVCVRMSFANVRGKYVEVMEREEAVQHEGWIVLLPDRPFVNALLFWKPIEDAPKEPK